MRRKGVISLEAMGTKQAEVIVMAPGIGCRSPEGAPRNARWALAISALLPFAQRASRRGSQVVRQRFAKPLYAGSIPAPASLPCSQRLADFGRAKVASYNELLQHVRSEPPLVRVNPVCCVLSTAAAEFVAWNEISLGKINLAEHTGALEALLRSPKQDAEGVKFAEQV